MSRFRHGCADAYLPNADAVGYYRFTMDETDFAALRKLVATLPPASRGGGSVR